MRYAAKRKQDVTVSKTPIETIIPLEKPVPVYTAKELAAMPLSVMNAAIAAQEKFYMLEETTHMGDQAIAVRRLMEGGAQFNSSSRKIQNTIQDQQRVCSTKDYSTVGEARIGEIKGGEVNV